MHNGSAIAGEVATGDKWLSEHIDAYAQWAVANNSLLVVTWDEDSSKYTIKCPGVITTTPPQNRIATLIIGEAVKAGTQSTTTYTHADLLRTILDTYGLAPFGDAASAKDITDIWN